jgi:tRNA(Met) C34 N-acetyltransferase TmcA
MYCGVLYVSSKYSVVCAVLSKLELDVYLTKYDVKRLEMYSNNLVDYHLIMDLVPALARLYFLNHMGDTHLSAVQSVSYISTVHGDFCLW